jgi:hypothetical protein
LTDSELRSRQTVEVNFMSRQISISRPRLLGLEGGVETKSRFLDLDQHISIVENHVLKVSRLRLSIETTLRQIETPRLTNN